MQDYRRLHVWRRAHRLALDVYAETLRWRRGHGILVAQARRAAMSMSTNITEGCGQPGATELARYLQISLASASELDYHLLFAADLGLLSRHAHHALESELAQVRRMLAVLRQRVLEARDGAN